MPITKYLCRTNNMRYGKNKDNQTNTHIQIHTDVFKDFSRVPRTRSTREILIILPPPCILWIEMLEVVVVGHHLSQESEYSLGVHLISSPSRERGIYHLSSGGTHGHIARACRDAAHGLRHRTCCVRNGRSRRWVSPRCRYTSR